MISDASVDSVAISVDVTEVIDRNLRVNLNGGGKNEATMAINTEIKQSDNKIALMVLDKCKNKKYVNVVRFRVGSYLQLLLKKKLLRRPNLRVWSVLKSIILKKTQYSEQDTSAMIECVAEMLRLNQSINNPKSEH